MDKIFISYRREDSEGFARSLFQSLVGRFGKDHVFMDVEAIGLGMDFVDAIDSSLDDCGALLVLIGKDWVNCADGKGRRRLEKDDDFVRLELAKAIERNVRVIPILVKGAQMPKVGELPEELRSLTRRQALELRHERWDHDVDHLGSSLEKALGIEPNKGPLPPLPEPPPKSKSYKFLGIIGAGLIGAVIVGAFIYNGIVDSFNPPPADPNVPRSSAQPLQSPSAQPQPSPSPAPARAKSLSGYWVDVTDGARVMIEQNGATAMSRSIDPATGVLIEAAWQIDGKQVQFTWASAAGNNGYGSGTISSDYNTIRYQYYDYITGIQDAGRLNRAAR